MVRTPADARELLEVAELVDIITFELRGKRVTHDGDIPEPVPAVAVRLSDEALETRLRLDVWTEDARIFADVAAVYALSEPVHLEGHVVQEFVERAGIMAVYPFVREAIFSTASRLGVKPPVLGLLRAGQFRIGGIEEGLNGGVDLLSPAQLGDELGVGAGAVRPWLRRHGRATGPSGKWHLDPDTAEEIRSHFRETRTGADA